MRIFTTCHNCVLKNNMQHSQQNTADHDECNICHDSFLFKPSAPENFNHYLADPFLLILYLRMCQQIDQMSFIITHETPPYKDYLENGCNPRLEMPLYSPAVGALQYLVKSYFSMMS